MAAIKSTQLDRYSFRCNRVKNLRKSEGIFSSSPLANILLVAFILTDAVCFYSMWNTVINDDFPMVILTAISMAIVVDVPMAIAGVVMAQGRDGLRCKKEANIIALGCLATFLLAFTLSLILRIVTKDQLISISKAGTGLVDNLENQAEAIAKSESPTSLIAAIFLAAIPCCTSAASYLVSLSVTDCIADRIKRLELQRIGIQSQIMELQQALSEFESVDDEIEHLIDRENALYSEFNAELSAMVIAVKESSRLVIMEKLGDPDSISKITESAAAIGKEGKPSIIPPQISQSTYSRSHGPDENAA